MDGDGITTATMTFWSMVAIGIPGKINKIAGDQIVITGVLDLADVVTTDSEHVATTIGAMQLEMI